MSILVEASKMVLNKPLPIDYDNRNQDEMNEFVNLHVKERFSFLCTEEIWEKIVEFS